MWTSSLACVVCQSYGAHHAQRVVGECYVGVEGCVYDFTVQILKTIETVYEFAFMAGTK